MKVYILKEKNVGNRPGAIMATYVVNDDIKPSAELQTKLAARGYELSMHTPNTVTSHCDLELSVCDEVRIDHDLEPGGGWPEV